MIDLAQILERREARYSEDIESGLILDSEGFPVDRKDNVVQFRKVDENEKV